MKKLLLLAIGFVFLTSCQFKEEITFNKNGSGEYRLSVDMGHFMNMVKEMGEEQDSLQKSKKPEIQDTLYKLSDMINKDTDEWKRLTDEEKELIKEMKDVSVKIHMNEQKGEMEMAYIYPFKKVSDLKGIMKKIRKLENNKKDKDGTLTEMDKSMPKTEVTYKFNKHRFKREVKLLEPLKKAKKEESQKDEMLNVMRYKLVYHFPYQIKSVSYKDALLSADRKTLIIEIPLSQISKNPKITEFEVEFD